MKKALEKGLLNYSLFNPREFGLPRHRQVDDSPYGGGAGMLLRADFLLKAYQQTSQQHTVCLSAQGKLLTAKRARELAQRPRIILVCGHYEGIDARFIRACVDEEISLGDYVLQGGEAAAQVLMEVVSRYVPGVLGNAASAHQESFEIPSLLEHPHYTRPRTVQVEKASRPLELKVPAVLLSGAHAKVADWRRNRAIFNTYKKRPELFKRLQLSLQEERQLKAEVCALATEQSR